MTLFWFAVAADYECPAIITASALCLVLLPLLFFVAQGIAEDGLILYCLYSMNLLYHWYLRPGNQKRW